jgi:Tfp pilus assembly protein PilX
MTKVIKRAHQQEGFVLATALLVMCICLLLGLATLQTVTAETHQSGYENAGEAAFNLAESALDVESLQRQNSWPSLSSAAYPATCNQSTTPTTGCPGTALTSSFSSTYAGPNFSSPTWSVVVLDDNDPSVADTNPNYYSDSLATATPLVTYDRNGDPRGGYATLTSTQLGYLKTTAQSSGTYYNGTCPTSAQLTASSVVCVENAGSCTYTTGTYNSLTSPGAVIFGNGTLTFNGNVNYDGIIYMADGQGTVRNAFSAFKAFAMPALAKNTFRIIPNR